MNDFGLSPHEPRPVDSVAPQPSPEDWAWECIGTAEIEIHELESALVGLEAALGKPVFGGMGFEEREVRAVQQEQFDLYAQKVGQLRSHVTDWFKGLELFGEGKISESDLKAILPTIEAQQPEDTQPKKQTRRQRQIEEIMATQGVSHWEALSILADRGDVTLRTDPRRVATGRNRTKVTSPNTDNPSKAQDEFVYFTADTHGGKSRRPSKRGDTYVGMNGKRIRKR